MISCYCAVRLSGSDVLTLKAGEGGGIICWVLPANSAFFTVELRPASPTKTGSNGTPVGVISNNGRAKRSVTKSLKQQSIDADADARAESAFVSKNREAECQDHNKSSPKRVMKYLYFRSGKICSTSARS